MKRNYRSLIAFTASIMITVPILDGCNASKSDDSELTYNSKKPITFTFFQATQDTVGQ